MLLDNGELNMKNIELKYLKILYTMLIIQYSYMIIMRLFNIDIKQYIYQVYTDDSIPINDNIHNIF